MKIEIPIDKGNSRIGDPKFGEKMNQLLTEVKAEAAYFTSVNGQRGAYIVVNMTDASQIPAMAEPFFLWFNANVYFVPVMSMEDLQKAGPAVAAAVQKWG